MPKKKYLIKLREAEREQLEQVLRSGKRREILRPRPAQSR